MKIYAVGGAVRDRLLGREVVDQDYVVVGATPEEMGRLGFRPVGRDFPVFLHPQTREEHALARTERKSGRGYRGFVVHASPEVTLEEDLRRRDLTLNAMARDEDGRLIDPFGGERDLREGVLRHVSEAFAEDPVRILRVARFAARFGFRVAAETETLMQAMVRDGEIEHLVPERVWQEISGALMERSPCRAFDVLAHCGALERLLPEVQVLRTEPAVWSAFCTALPRCTSLASRFALIAWFVPGDCGPPVDAMAVRLRAPAEVADLAFAVCQGRAELRAAPRAEAQALLALLKRADAFRRSGRFAELLAVAKAAEPEGPAARGADRAESARAAALSVDTGRLAQSGAQTGPEIAARIDAARLRAIAAALGC